MGSPAPAGSVILSFLLTGMQRAGTTLVEKLLCNHPDLSVLSQPLPFLMVEAKRRFLRTLDAGADPYPLGPLFRERRYVPEDLRRHLEGDRWSPAEVVAMLEEGRGSPGQYTEISPRAAARALGERPLDLAATLATLYGRLGPRAHAAASGAKETLAEELVPYLLARGFRAIVVLRDPRDVLASLNHGVGSRYGGRRKPTLFNLRNWRKSVAFALHLRSHPGFRFLRYEDLVERPLEELDRLAGLLGVAPFSQGVFEDGIGRILDQDGAEWRGNSSHGAPGETLSEASIGRYREVLPSEVVAFAEAVCGPEMRLLGYSIDGAGADPAAVIATFQDPYPVEREELRGYACDGREREDEIRRLELLREGPKAAALPFLLFPEAWQALHATP